MKLWTAVLWFIAQATCYIGWMYQAIKTLIPVLARAG